MADPKPKTPQATTNLDDLLGRGYDTGHLLTGKGAYVADNDAFRRIVTEVIKVNFPQTLKDSTAKISIEPTRSYDVLGTYSLWNDSIKISPSVMQGRYGDSVTDYYTNKGDKTRTKVDFNIAEVMDAAQVVLHELYHARSLGGVRNPTWTKLQKDFGLTTEDVAKVNKLQRAENEQFAQPFDSVGNGALNLEEFLAEADSILKLKSIGAIPSNSRVERKAATLEKILAEVPKIKPVIDAYERPGLSGIGGEAPPTTLLDIINKLTSLKKK